MEGRAHSGFWERINGLPSWLSASNNPLIRPPSADRRQSAVTHGCLTV